LAEGVVKAMLLAKHKTALGVLLVLGVPSFGGGDERPKKLARVSDPSPELRKELYALDAFRHGSPKQFAELERKADDLVKKYPARDAQARIYFEVAHIAGQSDIRRHVARVRQYARKSLALSRDPRQRGAAYTYLGSAAEVQEGKEFEDRRREAARELLAGYAEMLAQDLPAKAPELPPVDKVNNVDGPDRAAQDQARHAAQMAAREEAEFVGGLVSRRDTLANQLRWLFRPDPRVHGRNPEGPDELRALARKLLRNPAAVDALLAHVLAN
jgi:hypothetical protein